MRAAVVPSDDITGPCHFQNTRQARKSVEAIKVLRLKTAIDALVRLQAFARIEEAIEQPALIGPLEVLARHAMGVEPEFLKRDISKGGKPEVDHLEAFLLEGLDGHALDGKVNHRIGLGQMTIVLAGVPDQLATLVDGLEETERHQLAVAIEGEEPADLGLFRQHQRPVQKTNLAVPNGSSLTPCVGHSLDLVNADLIQRTFASDKPALDHAVDGFALWLLLRAIEIVAC